MCCSTALFSYQAERKYRRDSFLCQDTTKTSGGQTNGKLFRLPYPGRSNNDNLCEILQYSEYHTGPTCMKQVDQSLQMADTGGDLTTAHPGTDSTRVPATVPTISSAGE